MRTLYKSRDDVPTVSADRAISLLEEMLNCDDIVAAVTQVVEFLRRCRLYPELWNRMLEDGPRAELLSVFMQDPLTERARNKPRGYPGDAGLLDAMYYPESAAKQARTCLGEQICWLINGQPEPTAARARRVLLSDRIDSTCRTRRGPRILSVACGHLRELDLTQELQRCLSVENGVFVAVDQDAMALSEVERTWSTLGVKVDHASVGELLAGREDIEGFDLIYASGLYDYLTDKTAERLSRALFDRLRTGGRLLIANYLDNCPSAGYMEFVAQWYLTFRTLDAITRVVRDALPSPDVVQVLSYTIATVIGVVEVSKR